MATGKSSQILKRKLSILFFIPETVNIKFLCCQDDPSSLTLTPHSSSVIQIGDRKIEDGNKKMAMLGDTILQLAVLNDWFKTDTSRSPSSPFT